MAVTPDFTVSVAMRLLEDEDGPMLDLLKAFHGASIRLPEKRSSRPDPERLARRYEEFLQASG